MGELIIKASESDLWGISKLDADGDNMLGAEEPEVEYVEDDGTIVYKTGGVISLSWGWIVSNNDFYIFSLQDALKHCWDYIKQKKAVITNCDIRDTYYA